MTNKPMLSVELRALLERLLSHDFAEECQECGIGYSDAWGELRALLDKEVDMDSDASKHQGDPVAWRYKKSWEKTGWKVCDKHPTDYGIDDECYEIQALYAEQPAPVAVVMPFAEKVISKLQRFHECSDDGHGADIGRHWFDTLTQLGLLNRVQRSPALWEITDQGEDVLEVARLNGVKP